MKKEDPGILYSAILIKADVPNQNGTVFTAGALKQMAENNPKELKFKYDCLYGIHKEQQCTA